MHPRRTSACHVRSWSHSLCASTCLVALPRPVAAADFVWIEGEQPTSVNVEAKREGWGNQQFLSEGHWLSLSLDSQQVEKDVPAEGVLIQYAFAVDQTRRLRHLETDRVRIRSLPVRLAHRCRIVDARRAGSADDRLDGNRASGARSPGCSWASSRSPRARTCSRSACRRPRTTRAKPTGFCTPAMPSACMPVRSTRTPSSSPMRRGATSGTKRRSRPSSSCRTLPSAAASDRSAQWSVGSLSA